MRRIRTLAMSARSLSILVGFLLLVGCDAVGIEAPAEEPVSEGPAWNTMLSAVNRVRAAGATCGDVWYPPVDPLVWDGRLATAAERHSADMSKNQHFDHRGTDGRAVGERVRRAGYDWRAVGENIARHQVSVDQVMRDWVKSPGHCRQLLSPNYLELGAAKAEGYWTQVFGTARS